MFCFFFSVCVVLARWWQVLYCKCYWLCIMCYWVYCKQHDQLCNYNVTVCTEWSGMCYRELCESVCQNQTFFGIINMFFTKCSWQCLWKVRTVSVSILKSSLSCWHVFTEWFWTVRTSVPILNFFYFFYWHVFTQWF